MCCWFKNLHHTQLTPILFLHIYPGISDRVLPLHLLDLLQWIWSFGTNWVIIGIPKRSHWKELSYTFGQNTTYESNWDFDFHHVCIPHTGLETFVVVCGNSKLSCCAHVVVSHWFSKVAAQQKEVAKWSFLQNLHRFHIIFIDMKTLIKPLKFGATLNGRNVSHELISTLQKESEVNTEAGSDLSDFLKEFIFWKNVLVIHLVWPSVVLTYLGMVRASLTVHGNIYLSFCIVSTAESFSALITSNLLKRLGRIYLLALAYLSATVCLAGAISFEGQSPYNTFFMFAGKYRNINCNLYKYSITIFQ